jgi:hypothetical protein
MFRPQRGGLAESMDARVQLPPTKTALATHLSEPVADITVLYSCYDDRIDWETWTVCVRGNAVGFTNRKVFE